MSSTRYDFSGKVAIVTGGASGIGAAIVRRLLQSGAKVAVMDVSTATANLDLAVMAIDVDVTDVKAVEAAAAMVADRFGGIDMLVNCAGVMGPNAPLWEYDVAQWRRVIEVDLNGTFIPCRSCIPYMRKRGRGRIVNLASIAGKEGNANASAYSAAKAGVLALTKSLGKELADTQIRVNAIAPAMIHTTLFEQMSETYARQMIAKIPLGRPGTVDEIAALCLWLCSDDCSFCTGAVFDASGGRAVY
jgi:3-oxoacyl-[acyl-carrier protein] reductase